jgi:hypothetical protein
MLSTVLLKKFEIWVIDTAHCTSYCDKNAVIESKKKKNKKDKSKTGLLKASVKSRNNDFSTKRERRKHDSRLRCFSKLLVRLY